MIETCRERSAENKTVGRKERKEEKYGNGGNEQQRKDGVSNCSNLKALFHLFGGCTATIRHGLTHPKIVCAPENKERT